MTYPTSTRAPRRVMTPARVIGRAAWGDRGAYVVTFRPDPSEPSGWAPVASVGVHTGRVSAW